MLTKPEKPSPDFPLFAHARGYWAKKIDGKTHYFGTWDDPDRALADYKEFIASRSHKQGDIPAADNGKPKKPYRDFPLTAHSNGQWCKKIRGKLYYFGAWADPDQAMELYLSQRDDLQAGRTPRNELDGITLRELFNQFLTSKQQLLDTGELTNRTFEGYKRTCDWIGKVFDLNRLVEDLRADDFERLRADIAKSYGHIGVGNEINKTRIVFKYAYDAELIDRPLRFGPNFKRPSRKVLRLHRQSQAPRMFEAAELRAVIKGAGIPLRAMILLGINCGFGNADVGTLPADALDLKSGWHTYHRPKTGVERRCPLWPETIAAIEDSRRRRPRPTSDKSARLAFLTQRGNSWHKDNDDNPVSKEMAKLLQTLGLKRKRLNFYALRHTFETIAGDPGDQIAVDYIMGHAPDAKNMSAVYRERISDERLIRVTTFVHGWLFPRPTVGAV